MLHYAYGSNLSPTFLKGYCPSAKFVMKAYLSNFRVEFRFYSQRARERDSRLKTVEDRLEKIVSHLGIDVQGY